MSAVEFMSHGLKDRIAPPQLGSVKARLRHATSVVLRHDKKFQRRERRWTANRVRDAWYADPRISQSADEIRDIEEITGLRYGREEVREIDALIRQADALLDGQDSDFYSPFVAAMRSFVRTLARARIENVAGSKRSDLNSGRAAE